MLAANNGKVLIIGGCGYIGSRLFLFLKTKGYKVDTVDLEWYGNKVNPQNIKKNFNDLSKFFLNRYKTIILLAGYSSVNLSVKKKKNAFINDVVYFIELLEKLTHQRLIYASSSSIYGNTKKMKVTEDFAEYSPLNYYDLNKKVIDYYAQLSKIDYYGLRFGTVCGYSPHLRIDLMINKMFHSAYTSQKIVIHNPNMKRPILGMEDLCNCIEAIINGKSKPGIYNLASFNGTIGHVSKQVQKYVKKTQIVTKHSKSLYNFSVSTKKFKKNYNFTFKDNTKSIVISLQDNYDKIYKTTRE